MSSAIKRVITKTKRFTARYSRRARNVIFSAKGAALVFAVIIGVPLILGGMREAKNVYTADLLQTIAEVESNDNYNAYFGNAKNTKVQFTAMSVGEVLNWQQEFIEDGSPSSAVGRYQFLNTTLLGLTKELGIDHDEQFNQLLQDKLAVALLERRGLNEYVDRKMTREEFAHNLSQEWAALPKTIGSNPEKSYYDGDGLNSARLTTSEIMAGIATVRKL